MELCKVGFSVLGAEVSCNSSFKISNALLILGGGWSGFHTLLIHTFSLISLSSELLSSLAKNTFS
jgi:hypothetical protein